MDILAAEDKRQQIYLLPLILNHLGESFFLEIPFLKELLTSLSTYFAKKSFLIGKPLI